MPSKNSVNNKEVLKELEKKISPVLVVNNSSLKPYVELFDYAPENIYQQPLGSLVGFFEVKEYSQDSAYIVNFLTSVLKKEYYINPKRPVTESLDSALHKVNMALSELAKQGNVEWLGNINAAICVLEKNSAHFSVAGKAKIFLYRNSGLTEISEDLASDSPEPHPLKTFVNVSSGRMEKNDRLLITSEDIFHIFSILELKKNFQRFEGEKFVQFLKTALSNQMEMIASIVVEMNEEELVAPKKILPSKKPSQTANVFSEKTFKDKSSAILTLENLPLPEKAITEDSADYTDQKTGHIYVQGEDVPANDNTKLALYLDSAKGKMTEVWYLTKNTARKRFSLLKKHLAKKWQQRKEEKARLAAARQEDEKRAEEERVLRELEMEEQFSREKEQQRILLERQALQKQVELEQAEIFAKQQQVLEDERALAEKESLPSQEQSTNKQSSAPAKTQLASNKDSENSTFVLSFKEKLQLAAQDLERQSSMDAIAPRQIINLKQDQDSAAEIASVDVAGYASLAVPIHLQAEIEQAEKIQKNEARKMLAQKAFRQANEYLLTIVNLSKKQYTLLKQFKQSKSSHSGKNTHLAPQFSKIKKSFSRFSFQQKMYTALALALVFVVPLFIVHFLNAPKKPTIAQLVVTTPTPTQKLSGEKNINLATQVQTILTRTDIMGTLLTNIGPVVFTKNSVAVINGNQAKDYPLPAGDGSIVKATFMHDLALVFVVTDSGKVVSFSPVSLKYAENKITLPTDSSADFFGSYLTYLYVLDGAGNQIYRFPRADGGFGDGANWLKSGASVSGAQDMTIDDSIYTLANNQVSKFFKGQTQTLTLEASQTPVHFDKIYTSLDCSYLWALDKTNGRLVAYAKDSGKILSQYQNDQLKNGTALTVDEKNKIAYITTSSELISIALQ